MRHRRRVQGGFTLLELLMVVIIIAILASIALPQYLKTTEKARMSEAISGLSTLRQAEQRYLAENPTIGYGAAISNLDVDNPGSSPGAIYTYKVECAKATPSFVASATRAGTPPASCTAGYVLTIDQGGNLLGRDCQSTTVPGCI